MGYYCTVPQCTSLAGKTKNVKFHRFPRDVAMADKWNVILRRMKPYTKYSKVCSLHFTQADYNVTTMGQWKTLSKDAIPSQNLPKLNPDGTVMVIRKSRTVKHPYTKKDEGSSCSDKSEKWSPISSNQRSMSALPDHLAVQENNVSLRLQSLTAISNIPNLPATQNSNQLPTPLTKPKKQDAFMQTDPLQEDEEMDLNYSEGSEKSYNNSNSDPLEYSASYQNENTTSVYQKTEDANSVYQKTENSLYEKTENTYPKHENAQTEYRKPENPTVIYQESNANVNYQKLENSVTDYTNQDSYQNTDDYQKESFETPKDYTKSNEDYIPQTNEEYNKEAEKYALERKSRYEKPSLSESRSSVLSESYDKPTMGYAKQVMENSYQKLPPDCYGFSEKEYPRDFNVMYCNDYQDSVEQLRNQQQNLQLLQEQHRLTENQNFFDESHIKQEVTEDDKFLYDRSKDPLEASSIYDSRRIMDHLQHQVKQEPEVTAHESVMQSQSIPYYMNGHNNIAEGYYSQLSRPGPELLIAKQNALAAHTQLWQNMKRPFYYTDGSHYNTAINRYEDMTRLLQ